MLPTICGVASTIGCRPKARRCGNGTFAGARLGRVRFEIPAGRMVSGLESARFAGQHGGGGRRVACRLHPEQEAHPEAVAPLIMLLRLIAQRGGFLVCRRDGGEPGAKTIWLGLQQVAVFVEGMRHARKMNQG